MKKRRSKRYSRGCATLKSLEAQTLISPGGVQPQLDQLTTRLIASASDVLSSIQLVRASTPNLMKNDADPSKEPFDLPS